MTTIFVETLAPEMIIVLGRDSSLISLFIVDISCLKLSPATVLNNLINQMLNILFCELHQKHQIQIYLL